VRSSHTKIRIPKYWGPSIKALRPIRVYSSSVNIAVVTTETPDHESGVYFLLPDSSYLPTNVQPGYPFACKAVGAPLEFTFAKVR